MRIGRVMLVGAALALPVMAQAQSAPGWQNTLQGLLTGNQGQDDALRQAYQRGYERGRDDEARAMRTNDSAGRYSGRDGPYGTDPGPRPYQRDQDYTGR